MRPRKSTVPRSSQIWPEFGWSWAGDRLGVYTATATGATGPIGSEQVVVNLRATTDVAQEGALYSVGPT